MKTSGNILSGRGKAGEKRVTLFIAITLSVFVLVSYWGVRGNDFINYDDPSYVTANRDVEKGLSMGGVIWAFTTSSASNWHPLTWVSLMVDRELFGMHAGGYHWTSVILHLLSGLVLFFVLKRMTGRLWGSGVVAGLFLVHPLHVESVAWVAERKDVLSGLFWMLGLWAYARYVERPGIGRYGWVVFFFVLGLLSKPMVVTFPFVLLLLDWWPLGRVVGGMKGFLVLVYEKVPFFMLSAVGSVITFLVQREAAVTTLEMLPLSDRVANAVVSYAQYLVKVVWPVDLAVFYPHPGTLPLGEVFLSLGLLMVITLFTVMEFRRRPYLLVGWLWYLGVLVPVIGLVQVGSQGTADRYTYLPLIGIFIMVVWVFEDAVGGNFLRRVIGGVSAGVVMAVLVVATHLQVGHWKDSTTLFTHALKVTERNHQAHISLGNALVAADDYSAAVAHYREAIRISPHHVTGYYNLAVAQMKQGNLEDAITSNAEALKLAPGHPDGHFKRGELLAKKGMWHEALIEYRIASAKKPADPQLRNNLGLALIQQGRLDEAIVEFETAIWIEPEYAGAHGNLGILLMGRERIDEAIQHLRQAVKYQPEFASAHYQLSLALSRKGLMDEAVRHFAEACRINPAFVDMQKGADLESQTQKHAIRGK